MKLKYLDGQRFYSMRVGPKGEDMFWAIAVATLAMLAVYVFVGSLLGLIY